MMLDGAYGAGVGAAAWPMPSADTVDGVTILRSDPLPAGPLTIAVLPDAVLIALVPDALVPDALWPNLLMHDVTASGWKMAEAHLGFAMIDLDGYQLTIDDIRAEVLLANLASGQSTRIWGDAMFEVDGEAVGQFWGSTSLELANGMFITCGTAAAADNPNVYSLDKLTITRGAQALVIAAIGGEAGDMTVKGTNRNWSVDDATNDGLVLVEDADAGVWLTENRTGVADADYLRLTAPGEAFGPDGTGWSQREFGRVLSLFVQGIVQNTTSFTTQAAQNVSADDRRSDDARAAQVRAEHRRAAMATAIFHALPVVDANLSAASV